MALDCVSPLGENPFGHILLYFAVTDTPPPPPIDEMNEGQAHGVHSFRCRLRAKWKIENLVTFAFLCRGVKKLRFFQALGSA